MRSKFELVPISPMRLSYSSGYLNPGPVIAGKTVGSNERPLSVGIVYRVISRTREEVPRQLPVVVGPLMGESNAHT